MASPSMANSENGRPRRCRQMVEMVSRRLFEAVADDSRNEFVCNGSVLRRDGPDDIRARGTIAERLPVVFAVRGARPRSRAAVALPIQRRQPAGLTPAGSRRTRVNPIRVMVVDDSVVVRKIVTDVLSADPDIEVVGTAVERQGRLGKGRPAPAGRVDPRRRNADHGRRHRGFRHLQKRRSSIRGCLSSCSARSPSAALKRHWTRSPPAPATTSPSRRMWAAWAHRWRRSEQLIPKMRALAGRGGPAPAPVVARPRRRRRPERTAPRRRRPGNEAGGGCVAGRRRGGASARSTGGPMR